MKTIHDILDTQLENFDDLYDRITELKNKIKPDNLTYDEMTIKSLLSITNYLEGMSNIIDTLEVKYFNKIVDPSQQLTSRVRENTIDAQIQETFLPFMMYMRLLLQNQSN